MFGSLFQHDLESKSKELPQNVTLWVRRAGTLKPHTSFSDLDKLLLCGDATLQYFHPSIQSVLSYAPNFNCEVTGTFPF